jgi:hypothetical protein
MSQLDKSLAFYGTVSFIIIIINIIIVVVVSSTALGGPLVSS